MSVGGSGYEDASLAKILGPSFPQEDIPDVIRKLVNVHLINRQGSERFIDTYRRIGLQPYKEAVLHVMKHLIRKEKVVPVAHQDEFLFTGAIPFTRRQANNSVQLEPDEEVEVLADHLKSISVIALHFPAFSDGRHYSSASILRHRFNYQGEIRAIGDVRVDQLEQMGPLRLWTPLNWARARILNTPSAALAASVTAINTRSTGTRCFGNAAAHSNNSAISLNIGPNIHIDGAHGF